MTYFMKKKIKLLLEDPRLLGNTQFEKLHKSYESAKLTLEKSKETKGKAKTKYRNAETAEGQLTEESRFRLRMAFRKAKYMHLYHRADGDLAEYRLSTWLKNWATEQTSPAEELASKPKKATKKSQKPTAMEENVEKVAKPKSKNEIQD